jgi:hypothetical protein
MWAGPLKIFHLVLELDSRGKENVYGPFPHHSAQ